MKERVKRAMEENAKRNEAGAKMTKIARGFLGRLKAKRRRRELAQNVFEVQTRAARQLQRMERGRQARALMRPKIAVS